MANITSITHGSSNWDAVANQNFNNLKTGINDVITTTDWITDGFSLLNGTALFF